MQAVYVGQLYEGRGIELIFEVAQRAPWADFHIVGGMDEAITRWRKKSNNLKNFHLHGFVPPSQTTRFLQAADVLLAPYQNRVSIAGQGDTSLWMSPLKVFEYMAAGRAIIISSLPVLNEILEHDRTAVMLPPTDIEAWVEAMRHMHQNYNERLALGKSARSEFLKHHTWRNRASNILKHYAPSRIEHESKKT